MQCFETTAPSVPGAALVRCEVGEAGRRAAPEVRVLEGRVHRPSCTWVQDAGPAALVRRRGGGVVDVEF